MSLQTLFKSRAVGNVGPIYIAFVDWSDQFRLKSVEFILMQKAVQTRIFIVSIR